MKNLTWQNPEQLFVAQELINKVKSKCCGIKGKEELDYFFYLSSTHSAEFERLIAENYIKAKTVTDLAQMIGYGVNSFRMKFKKVFGIPAYEWLMQEKSKRLLVAIANSEDDFKNIIDEFDFSSHSHFYKFCKARFGYSPTELRKKLKSL